MNHDGRVAARSGLFYRNIIYLRRVESQTGSNVFLYLNLKYYSHDKQRLRF